MSTSHLYEMVFSPGGIEHTLQQTGRLPESWVRKYLAEIHDARASFDGATAWPKRVFQALHFSSMHLPMRYDVWARSTNTANSKTEQVLAEIRFETEAYLWSSLSGVDRWKLNVASNNEVAAGKSAISLIDLCFGDISPVVEVDRSTAFRSWKDSYEECLRNIELDWKTAVCWPKWICMAIHYASFYIDLFQSQCIDVAQVATEVEDDTLRRRIDDVIHELGKEIKNEASLNLIRLWLSACGCDRDSSGLPRVGVRRPRTGQFISVRTPSEVFLLGDAKSS